MLPHKQAFINLSDIVRLLQQKRGEYYLRDVDKHSVEDIETNIRDSEFDAVRFGIPTLNIASETIDLKSVFRPFESGHNVKIWNPIFAKNVSHMVVTFTPEMLDVMAISDGQHRISALCQRFQDDSLFATSVMVVNITNIVNPLQIKRFSLKQSMPKPHVRQSVYDLLACLSPMTSTFNVRQKARQTIENDSNVKLAASMMSKFKKATFYSNLTDLHVYLFEEVRKVLDTKRSLMLFSPDTLAKSKVRPFTVFFRETSQIPGASTQEKRVFKPSERLLRKDCQLFGMILITSCAELCQAFETYEPSDIIVGVASILNDLIRIASNNMDSETSKRAFGITEVFLFYGVHGTVRFISRRVSGLEEADIYLRLKSRIIESWKEAFSTNANSSSFSVGLETISPSYEDFVKGFQDMVISCELAAMATSESGISVAVDTAAANTGFESSNGVSLHGTDSLAGTDDAHENGSAAVTETASEDIIVPSKPAQAEPEFQDKPDASIIPPEVSHDVVPDNGGTRHATDNLSISDSVSAVVNEVAFPSQPRQEEPRTAKEPEQHGHKGSRKSDTIQEPLPAPRPSRTRKLPERFTAEFSVAKKVKARPSQSVQSLRTVSPRLRPSLCSSSRSPDVRTPSKRVMCAQKCLQLALKLVDRCILLCRSDNDSGYYQNLPTFNDESPEAAVIIGRKELDTIPILDIVEQVSSRVSLRAVVFIGSDVSAFSDFEPVMSSTKYKWIRALYITSKKCVHPARNDILGEAVVLETENQTGLVSSYYYCDGSRDSEVVLVERVMETFSKPVQHFIDIKTGSLSVLKALGRNLGNAFYYKDESGVDVDHILPKLDYLRSLVLEERCTCKDHCFLRSDNEDELNIHEERYKVDTAQKGFMTCLTENDQVLLEGLKVHASIEIQKSFGVDGKLSLSPEYLCKSSHDTEGRPLHMGLYISLATLQDLLSTRKSRVDLIYPSSCLVDIHTAHRDFDNAKSNFELRELYVSGISHRLYSFFFQNSSFATFVNEKKDVSAIFFDPQYLLSQYLSELELNGGIKGMKSWLPIIIRLNLDVMRTTKDSWVRCPICNAVELFANYGHHYIHY